MVENIMLRLSRPAKPRSIAVEAPGGTIEIVVKRSRRARRMLLKLDAAGDGFSLTLPPFASLGEATSFAHSQARWMAERLAKVPPRIPFGDGALVPVLGQILTIRHVGGSGRPVTRDGDELRVTGAPEHLKRRVRDHLIALARREIVAHAEYFGAAVNRPVRHIVLRDPVTRWGSCSVSGALSLSWRLVLMPECVLRYVVAHEVAHLVELNHGPRFWALVDRLVPDSDYCRDWLRENGQHMLRYG
jgi:predicted metal-dependent hydrolase